MCHKKDIPQESSLQSSTPIFLPACWTSPDDPQAPQMWHIQSDALPDFLLCPLFWVMSQTSQKSQNHPPPNPSFRSAGGGGLVAKSCPTLATPRTVACQAPLSMGFFQARILEWIAISFFRWSSRPRNWTRVSCIAGRFFTNWAIWSIPNPKWPRPDSPSSHHRLTFSLYDFSFPPLDYVSSLLPSFPSISSSQCGPVFTLRAKLPSKAEMW